MLAHIYNPSTQEIEAGGSGVQGHPQLHSELKARKVYIVIVILVIVIIIITIIIIGAEIAWLLRALDVLAEELNLIPSTHMAIPTL